MLCRTKAKMKRRTLKTGHETGQSFYMASIRYACKVSEEEIRKAVLRAHRVEMSSFPEVLSSRSNAVWKIDTTLKSTAPISKMHYFKSRILEITLSSIFVHRFLEYYSTIFVWISHRYFERRNIFARLLYDVHSSRFRF